MTTSSAPTSTGLRIERRFTTAGADPFAGVEFARRNARIANPDGSVVFEMNDIEVPAAWDQVAVDVLASKYFRKAGVPQVDENGQQVLDDALNPVLGPERSAKQWALRLANAWRHWGVKGGYFASDADADAFRDEFVHILITQKASPNSPQHFNTGLFEAYGILNDPNGEWYYDPEAGEVRESEHRYERSSANACFLLSVDDQLVGDGSIFDSFEREARLFQGGSGAGSNFSRIRGKDELLSGGGRASGLMSFLKVSDASAGAIKSGGTTRRAAKMVIVDVDHPEVFEFVWAKAREEEKAAALVAAGWDPAWNAEDGAFANVNFQNFNGSVMVSTEFMNAVDNDTEWHLTARTTGETMRVVRARDLWNQIAEAAHACADPGVMYRTIINDWNTAANDAEIVTSNPCVTADAWVMTANGPRQVADLVGTKFDVLVDGKPQTVLSDGFFPTGTKDVFDLHTIDGHVLRLTGDHQMLTQRGWVPAVELTVDDSINVQLHDASWDGNGTLDEGYLAGLFLGDGSTALRRDAVRSAFLLSWDDGTDGPAAVRDEAQRILAQLPHRKDWRGWHRTTDGGPFKMNSQRLTEIVEHFGLYEKQIGAAAEQASSEFTVGLLRGLFDTDGHVEGSSTAGGISIRLSQSDKALLRSAQRMLARLGIHSVLRGGRPAGVRQLPDGKGGYGAYECRASYRLIIAGHHTATFMDRVGFGDTSKSAKYEAAASSMTRGFYAKSAQSQFAQLVPAGTADVFDVTVADVHCFDAEGLTAHNCGEYLHVEDTACNLASINLVEFWDDAAQAFDGEEFAHVSRLVEIMLEITVSMSHYPSALIAKNSFEHRTTGIGYANLGALLMRAGLPYDSDGARAAMGAITALMHLTAYTASTEMAGVVGPAPAYERNTEHANRVVRNHIRAAYGSHLEDSSLGDFEKLAVRPQVLDHDVLAATPFGNLSGLVIVASESLLVGVEEHGLRNMFISCIAPTGTIGLQMSCDTTGVEPAYALVIGKKLAGGGYMKIVNDSVTPALRNLGYSDGEIASIIAHALGTGTLDGGTSVNRGSLAAKGVPADRIDALDAALPAAFSLDFAAAQVGVDLAEAGFSAAEIAASSMTICGHHTVEGAAALRDEHLAVFDCANYCGDGTRSIAWSGHVKALGAVAPFVSGSISKTVNMPENVSVEDIKDAYEMTYRLGVKNCAIYRDNSKGSQVLSSGSVSDKKAKADEPLEPVAAVVETAEDIIAKAAELMAIQPGISPTAYYHGRTPAKFKMPATRFGPTWKFNVGGDCEVFVRANEYEDGTLGEIFIDLSREGSTLKGILSCFAISVSHGLQYGVPLSKFVDTFCFHTFEPRGMVDHEAVRMCNSIVDAIFRILGWWYLDRQDLVHVKAPAKRPQRLYPSDGTTAEMIAPGIAAAPTAAPSAAAPAAAPAPSAVAVDEDTDGKPRNEPGPPCSTCGNATVRSGACFRCLSCGDSSGCS